MQMKVVNDKLIANGSNDIYKVSIDEMNGCNRLLSVMLAWYGEFLLASLMVVPLSCSSFFSPIFLFYFDPTAVPAVS